MQGATVYILDPIGIHARPAAKLVQTAGRYRTTTISLTLLATARTANARSITALLGLGARQGSIVEITASGDDEADALAAILAVMQVENLIGDPQPPEEGELNREEVD